MGVMNGWQGLIDGSVSELGLREVSGHPSPRRDDPRHVANEPVPRRRRRRRVPRNFAAQRLRRPRGGRRRGHARRRAVAGQEQGLPVVGVPKTIDNDLSATDYTFGFDTAVPSARSIDRLHTTAESHNRVMVVEVMGRYTGWIAVMSGIAGGADVILIPEHPLTVEETCASSRSATAGKDFSIIVVSEGYTLRFQSGEERAVVQELTTDEFGHVRLGGIGAELAKEIEERTGFETRYTVLGHVQRGGSPTARDRVLATRFGLRAAELVHEGRFGRMAALQGDAIVDVPLADAVAERKTVPPDWYAVARAFFG